MTGLLRKPHPPDTDGLVHRITPADAGWEHVGFELYRLDPGQSLERNAGERETCLVLLDGRADLMAGDRSWRDVGDRADLFEDKSPYALYVPFGEPWRVHARSAIELAVCTAPGGGAHRVRLIEPGDIGVRRRGRDGNARFVRNILDESIPAHALMVVEVVTPGGHWSSYPPHKHDTDDLPAESRLEETYYHRLRPRQGFALQRIYTQDRSLDVSFAVEDGDVVLVPRGYHPCVAAWGYDLYYLNVMAGPKRVWRIRTDPDHYWLLSS